MIHKVSDFERNLRVYKDYIQGSHVSSGGSLTAVLGLFWGANPAGTGNLIKEVGLGRRFTNAVNTRTTDLVDEFCATWEESAVLKEMHILYREGNLGAVQTVPEVKFGSEIGNAVSQNLSQICFQLLVFILNSIRVTPLHSPTFALE